MADDWRLKPYAPVRGYVTNHQDTYDFINPLKADLTGKSVLVTGASRGIGKATAVHFATAGCSKIAIAARSSLSGVEQEIKAAAEKAQRPAPHVLVLQVDITSQDSVRAAAEATEKAFGGTLDVLINNAGYGEERKPMAETDPTDWWKAWEVNLKGTFLCTHFFLPLVLRSDSKMIINVSSAGAHYIVAGATAYQGARFAACRFTEGILSDYEDQGIWAISLHPGAIKTELAMRIPKQWHFMLTDELELPADTMVWLAKTRPDWLNGRFVSATWDMEELEAKKSEIVARDSLKFRMVV